MISYRLETLVKCVSSNDKIIDIGCDHALLDIYLVKNKYVKNIIVSDVHEDALASGISNIKKYKLTEYIDARCGNGLEVLTNKDDIDTILISGMGTNTILKILNNDYLKNINKLILQSNNDHELLRRELVKLGFYIKSEEYFVDNKKNYINIEFRRGKIKYTKEQIKYGPILIYDKDYLNFELNNCYRIYKLIPNMKLKYRLKLKHEINYLNKLLKNL